MVDDTWYHFSRILLSGFKGKEQIKISPFADAHSSSLAQWKLVVLYFLTALCHASFAQSCCGVAAGC